MSSPIKRRRFLSGVGLVLLLGAAVAGCGGGHSDSNPENSGGRIYPLSSLQQVPAVAKGTTLELWVMDTEGKRDEGMMNLSDSDVGDNEGMLFVFPDSDYRYFWMKDTGIPLDLACLDSTGTVVSIAQLTPYDLDAVYSIYPAMYAIEMKQGAFARIGITTGVTIALPAVSAH